MWDYLTNKLSAFNARARYKKKPEKFDTLTNKIIADLSEFETLTEDMFK